MIYSKQITFCAGLVFTMVVGLSCKKFLEVPPPKSSIISDRVFANEETAEAAALGIYTALEDENGFGSGLSSVTMLGGLSADELLNRQISDGYSTQFNANDLMADNPRILSLWTSFYQVIYRANAVIEGLEASSSVSAATKNRLVGEALCIRAFCHFYLVNLFGQVPLVTSTDYKINAAIKKSPQEKLYLQLIDDLKHAKRLLPVGYYGGERIRPNKAIAHALLARTYLYAGKWEDAKLEADSVLQQTALYKLVSPDSVFLKNSSEAIWQVSPVGAANVGRVSETFFFLPLNVLGYNVLRGELYAAFETGDLRKERWTGVYTTGGTFYYPTKYKDNQPNDAVTEYAMLMRLAEIYLIRAEARAYLNDFAGARADINAIRNRASLGNVVANNLAELLQIILKERRTELFTEWGHRWLDLKRMNSAGSILAPIKPKWNTDDVLYPLPQAELNNNQNLRPQNSGY